MSESRLTLALETGAVLLPETGRIAVFRPRADADLSALPKDRVQIIQGFRPDHDAWAGRDFAVEVTPDEGFSVAIVMVPRAKAEARSLIATALKICGLVIVDGQKTDGIDSLMREMRTRAEVTTPFSKAHGKCFQVTATAEVFADWILPTTIQLDNGWITAPGLFSADGPDPASVALGAKLPAKLPGRVADLGAGWGYLSQQILERKGVTEVALVEAEHAALDVARQNIQDDRARYHWADATTWSEAEPFDHVVMNPPFHTSRTAEPALGAAFIAAAARILKPHGGLWMVANRHLPYEASLKAAFREITEHEGTPGFKIVHARKPIQKSKGHSGSRPRR